MCLFESNLAKIQSCSEQNDNTELCYTGKDGYKSINSIASILADTLSKKQIEDEEDPKKIKSKNLLFASTGTIGETFPEKFQVALASTWYAV